MATEYSITKDYDNFIPTVLLESDELTFPETLLNFWKPVLRLFQENGLLPMVLENLAHGLSDKSTVYDRLRAGWIATVVISLKQRGTISH